MPEIDLTIHSELLKRLADAELEYLKAHDEGVRLAASGAPLTALHEHAGQRSTLKQVVDYLRVAVKETLVASKTGASLLAESETSLGPTDGPGWASVGEIAERFGYSAQTIRNKIHDDEILGVRVGRSFAVNVASAAKFFDRLQLCY